MPNIYKEMKALSDDFVDRYGGMMSLSELSRELGVNRDSAKRWAAEKGIGNNTVQCVSGHVKYDSRLVARAIVNGRGYV